MAELRPYPLASLLRRALSEVDTGSVFDLPLEKAFLEAPANDYSIRFHGIRASTPLGPAAGPHSQMAQNLALAWLSGSRILELKTVQINDRLTIPRPCIDMQTVGYNVEWSQELRLEESLEEYVKGAILARALAEKLGVPDNLRDTVLDMSVGYDLAGIQSDRVQEFISGMKDATEVLARLRRELPTELAWVRDLDVPTALSKTLTLSTFHGCPPGEIERILEFLLESGGLNCIVKLNPTLLGPTELRGLLHDVMGYREVFVPDSAFDKDTRWEQAVGFVDRLGQKASSLGLGFGVKFSNTLICRNHRDFIPKSEKEMYLSGPPLHVLAMNLVGRFRKTFGDRFPISFSAGIDAKNFSDAVALGLVPITVCSDFLKPGGYGRAKSYWKELSRRMDQAGANTIDELVLRGFGHAASALARATQVDEVSARAITELPREASRKALTPEVMAKSVSEAKLLNTETYVARVTRDPEYAKAKNQKPPKKIGRKLELFDCLTCDKCVPVCPNDANFTLTIPVREVPIQKLVPVNGGFNAESHGTHVIKETHQLANFADFCNECGNCDVFCPEDGGPYAIKPRFFGRASDFEALRNLDGFLFDSPTRMRARFGDREFGLEVGDGRATFRGAEFEVQFDPSAPESTAKGMAKGEVDLTYFVIMDEVRKAVFASDAVNYVKSLGSS
ncbi:MAG: glutamate synthase [Deltaproteobacteria bacterium]|nr:glutamate synthase [Deltaproteobacteria bacterium]